LPGVFGAQVLEAVLDIGSATSSDAQSLIALDTGFVV